MYNMRDISNKFFVFFLFFAMIVMLGNAVFLSEYIYESENKMSGYATALVNFSLNSSVGCNPKNVDLGTGNQPSGQVSISTETLNTDLGLGFNACNSGTICTGMTINNTGNVFLNVTFNSSADGTNFPGNQTPSVANDFRYWVRNGTGISGTIPGCLNYLSAINTAAAQVAVPNTTMTVACGNLTYNSTNSAVTIEYNVTLQRDVKPGLRVVTIGINCVQN
jgi:hypothetical protein